MRKQRVRGRSTRCRAAMEAERGSWSTRRRWRRVGRAVRRAVGHAGIAGLAVAVAVAGIGGQPVFAGPAKGHQFTRLTPQRDRSVPITVVGGAKRGSGQDGGKPSTAGLPQPAWPKTGSKTVKLPKGPGAGSAPVAAVDAVSVAPAHPQAADSPSAVSVDVLPTPKDSRARRPVVMRVKRADGAAEAGAVSVAVDYSKFKGAYGGDWANRLRLVRLPECALTTPGAPQCQPTPLASKNTGTTVTAEVGLDTGAPAASRKAAASGSAAASDGAAAAAASDGAAPAAGSLLSVDSAPSGAAGSFGATSLSQSSTWTAGSSSGDFGWSYPMRTPPALGGPDPEIGLSYSSQSVDGRMAASNNQPSWIGEGFDFSPGFIERRYKSCSDDGGSTGDECWGTANATMSMNGGGGELVRDDATGTWHPRDDDGSRVELLTNPSLGNGDNDGEYWKITKRDGTQYFFGLNRITGWSAGRAETRSTWTVPVYGNNAGEPCHQSTFEASWCQQAWRWNLDYVVDANGNSMSYWYTPETNSYARNLDSSQVSSYTRGGYLSRIDYGTRSDAEFGDAPMRVSFAVGDRCVAGTGCDKSKPTTWPDTPLDQECAATAACGVHSPTFFTQKRLASVTTQVRNAANTGYRDVDRWTLNHRYLDPGDSTRAGLVLESITHSGRAGIAKDSEAIDLPKVWITYRQLANRVDTDNDQRPRMNWWRIAYIDTETGGRLGVEYSAPDCVAGTRVPTSPEHNTLRCYPVKWTPQGWSEPVTDYFHKYVVTTVTESDMTSGGAFDKIGGNENEITSYAYEGDPAWHYTDEDGLTPQSQKTWSVWRGYEKVVTTSGRAPNQRQSVSWFFRGMDGDKLPNGRRTVTVADSKGNQVPDADQYAGIKRATQVRNGPGGAEVNSTATDMWSSPPTATRVVGGVSVVARYTETAGEVERTTLDGGRGSRVTETVTSYDDLGMPYQVWDKGEEPDPTDDQCLKTTYLRNPTAWIMDKASRVESYAKPCGTAPTSEDDVLEDTRFSFDGQAYGAPPTRGDGTRVESAKAWSTSGVSYLTVSETAYDAHGRVTKTIDPDGGGAQRVTTTRYTPATGGPVTRVDTTDPMEWSSFVEVDPAWGATTARVDSNGKRTEVTYDALGRTTAVWLPGRNRGTQTANATYSYLTRTDKPSAVISKSLNAAGNYGTTIDLYDGLLRKRQSQTEAAGGGRILTETFTNSAGETYKQYGPYYNDTPYTGDGYTKATGPVPVLFAGQENQVPNQNLTLFDPAGRATDAVLIANGAERWRTVTGHGGDRVDVVPPEGGTATSTFFDAEGRTTERRQYHGSARDAAGRFTAGYDSTRYVHGRRGELESVTDAAGNTWTYQHDLRGRLVRTTDPDRGVTTATFNDNDEQLTATDARGVTLSYTYDALGHRTGVYEGADPATGKKRAEWTFYGTDATGMRGQPESATRWIDGSAYTSRVLGYDDRYQPTGQAVTIPAREGALAGTYTTYTSYNVDGSVATVKLPATGSLRPETLSYGYDATSGLPTTLETNYGGTSFAYVGKTQYTRYGEASVVTLGKENGGKKLAQLASYYDEATRRVVRSMVAKETAPSLVVDAKYAYTAAGQVTAIADEPAGSAADVQCFTHDYLGRTTEAWTPRAIADASATATEIDECAAAPTAGGLGGAAPYWQTWQFDSTGNRTSQVDHATAAGDVTTSYAYPGAGKANAHSLSATTTTDVANAVVRGGYTYDAAGNTLTKPGAAGDQTLTWDPEGHLAKVTEFEGESSYVYDAAGNRLVSHDPDATTLYLGAMELKVDKATSKTTATRVYDFAGTSVACRTTDAGLNWLGADHHGTQSVSIDVDDQLVTKRYLSPFGTERGAKVSWLNSRGFVDGTVDPTGMIHLGAREYDPTTGRFLSVDPVIDPDNPQQLNGYAYANNSPETIEDADGLCWPKWACKALKKAGKWVSKHQGEIAGFVASTVVGAACTAATGGAGVIGCAALAGAVGSMVTYAWESKVQKKYPFSASGLLFSGVVGAVTGAATAFAFGVGGKLLKAAGGKLGKTSLGKAVSAGAKRIGGKIRGGRIGKATTGGSKAYKKAPGGGGNASRSTKGVSRSSRTCHSFPPATKVLMADGTAKPLMSIRTGDKVAATDPSSGRTVAEPVTQVHVNRDHALAEVVVRDVKGATSTLRTTLDHPVWDATNRGWKAVADLTPGTALAGPDGSAVTVVEVRAHLGDQVMLDLTVATIHTYYVVAGSTPVLVHNCGESKWTPDENYSPEAVARRSAANKAYYKTPQDIHDLVTDVISNPNYPQRMTGPAGNRRLDVYGAHGAPRSALKWRGSAIYDNGDPLSQARILVDGNGNIAYVGRAADGSHNYNQIIPYPWATRP